MLSLLLWLLIAPFVITIDTIQNQYEIQLISIGWVKLVFEKEQALLRLKIFFFKKTILLDPARLFKSKPKKKPKKRKKKKKPVRWLKMKNKFKRVIQSFQLKKFWLNIDTDNFYYNAFIYPIFFFIKGKNYRLNINYQGINEFSLVLRNRPIRILFALLF